MGIVKVAALQHDIVWEDPAANFARLAPRIEHAVDDGARLVLMSEMYATGFSMDAARIAEADDGPSCAFIAEQAAAHGVWVGGSVPALAPGAERPSNCFVLASPTGAVHRYRKIHPFSYGGEHEVYDAGAEHCVVVVDGLRGALFVCYDLRFADEFWALAPGVDCYLVPANWPSSRREHWRTLLRARAIENQAYVVGVNRVGHGGGLDYAGDSMVVGPFGEILAEATQPVEVTLRAELDPAVVAATRGRYPFLADRRDA
ncbi:MAG: carbon-nitrogen family hydrolase [Acidimicrobiia bacterium]